MMLHVLCAMLGYQFCYVAGFFYWEKKSERWGGFILQNTNFEVYTVEL